MRLLSATCVLATAVLAFTACSDPSTGLPTNALKSGIGTPAAGFDQYGYNEAAGIFNGPADGIDRVMDGLLWGSPLYASDHLVMKWNKAWPNGDGAWLTNEWNGRAPGGSGEVWHYKIVRLAAPCGAYGTPLPDGGYCLWGQYEMIMSHGSVGNQHFWDAHARPTGFGS